jgi:hypothetical protein
MNVEKNTIRVRIEGSVYREPNTDERQLDVYFSFGSPLINAIATVLARVSGKPVVIVKRRVSPSDEDAIVEYRIVDEEEYYSS